MSNVVSTVRRGVSFARRRPDEALLVARLALDVASFSMLARVLPLPRSLSFLSPARRRDVRARESRVSDERLAQLLDALLSLDALCFTPTCWKRAAVLHRQMALRGRQTRVVFGVRRGEGDPLAGHAWLEAGGVPLFETSPPEYAVTYCFPS
ncbi:MAG: Transglutaminase-like superfamily [Acidobacteriota bacterium]|nr:Transglutaminase-like superfamily [Acidobacteriota bacterium]